MPPSNTKENNQNGSHGCVPQEQGMDENAILSHPMMLEDIATSEEHAMMITSALSPMKQKQTFKDMFPTLTSPKDMISILAQ